MSTNAQGVPPWPSLYNPGYEILRIQHNEPLQPQGFYLYHVKDVFRFTLYWTLIFYTPLFLLCGAYAFWNYAFPPSPRFSNASNGREPAIPLTSMVPNSAAPLLQPTKSSKSKELRSRATFALIVLLTFITLSLAGAVIGAAILGSVATGLYKAGNFNMSTWIPFLLAIMQVIIGLLSIWPSIIEII